MAHRPSVKKGSEKRYKDFLKIFGPVILVTPMGFIVAYQFVDPAPPERISMATGSETGAYYPFGLRCREVLARYGIALEVRATAGSIASFPW